MNFGLLCIIFVISETNSFYVEDDNFLKEVEEKRVLLRKLQNLQEHDATNAHPPSWSEILANVLVKRLFSFHKPNNENERITKEDEKNIWVRSFSFVLKIYKRYLYDKLRHDTTKVIKQSEVNTTEIVENKEVDIAGIDEPKSDVELNATEIVDNKVKANVTEIDNPNDEVELIEPKYHGKLCDNCKESGEIEIDDCDTVKADGKCVIKSSKFIMSVPLHCPVGYRRDWLGYCRVIL